VRRAVEDRGARPQRPLPLAGRAGRIGRRPEVMIDMAAGVTGLAHGAAQMVFWRGERTGPVGELDQHPPPRRRPVEPGQPGPAPDRQAAERHERDERQVEQRHGVGDQAERVRHRGPACPVAPRGGVSGPETRGEPPRPVSP